MVKSDNNCVLCLTPRSDKPCEFDSTEFLNTEEEDVKQFLKEHEDNSGILDILHYYLVALAEKYNLKW